MGAISPSLFVHAKMGLRIVRRAPPDRRRLFNICRVSQETGTSRPRGNTGACLDGDCARVHGGGMHRNQGACTHRQRTGYGYSRTYVCDICEQVVMNYDPEWEEIIRQEFERYRREIYEPRMKEQNK